MQDLEARNKLHCHGNEAPWTDFSQDTARLAADVRAALELAASWQGQTDSRDRRTAGTEGQRSPSRSLPWPGWVPCCAVLAQAPWPGRARLSGTWRKSWLSKDAWRSRRGSGRAALSGDSAFTSFHSTHSVVSTATVGRAKGLQQLSPTSSPLSPPPQGSSLLPGLRPDTTHCRAAPEQPCAAARVTHTWATLPPVSALTCGPSLALGTGHPSWLGGCFGRGGGSWTRLGGERTGPGAECMEGGGTGPCCRGLVLLHRLQHPPPQFPISGAGEKGEKKCVGDKSTYMHPPLQQSDLLVPAPQMDRSMPPEAMTLKH